MKKISFGKLSPFAFLLALSTGSAAIFDSATSGNWDAASTGTWTPAGNPQTGTTDSVNILTGHTVIWTGANGVGLPGSGDFGTSNGNVVNINGGILSQTQTGFWVRIGQTDSGTMNVNDGAFFFTNTVGTGSTPNLQIGVAGGSGTLNIGDGTGAAGSAKVDLAHVINGADNGIAVSMNLGSNSGGALGNVTIKSDGVLIGDIRTSGAASNPVIRIGQVANALTTPSTLTVLAGGQFQAHGTIEVGSDAPSGANRSKGAIVINGAGARMDQDGGEFNVGWNGDGSLMIDNGGVYSKTNNASNRLDVLIGREATGVGTVTVQNGGQFLRGTGGDVADMRIGLRGTGTMTINNGGLVQNDAGNWDWIGQESGGNGTLNVNAGGIFRTTQGSNFNVGINAGSTGLVVVNGGLLDLQNTGAAQIRLGQNGNATFRQISGTTNAQLIQTSENNGTTTFDLQGGTMNIRAQFFMGGAGAASVGTGVSTGTQSGGTLNVAGALVVGIAPAHTATYTMTGGLITHTGSDISVGESGIGTLSIGAGATLTDTTPGGTFFVGRNTGSSGTVYVNGSLSRVSTSPMRIGNGDSAGVDNTTAPGILGGTGSITTTNAGINIGTFGTLTGGTISTVGTLAVTSNVTFSAAGTLYANFDTAGNVDLINLTGSLALNNSNLSGNWQGGAAPVGPGSRYWLVDNDGADPISGLFANVVPTSLFSSLYPTATGFVTIGSQEFAVFQSADKATNALTGGNDLLLSAVPEPGSTLLLGLMAGLGLVRRKR